MSLSIQAMVPKVDPVIPSMDRGMLLSVLSAALKAMKQFPSKVPTAHLRALKAVLIMPQQAQAAAQVLQEAVEALPP